MAAASGRSRWRRRVYWFTLFGVIQFLILTALAMLAYPGGTHVDPASPGYAFFANFFSDLGRIHAHNGVPNTLSVALFVVALSVAGLSLILFFLATLRDFQVSTGLQALSGIGSVLGILTGAGFVGVAWTPADVFPEQHIACVLLAFRAFPAAAILYSVAILRHPAYPRRYGVAYLTFAILLGAYLWLLTNGPALDSAQGLLLQVAGQKAIVYATIVCMGYQGLGALGLGRAAFWR
ncbi:MAG: hypothetical protein HPY64_13420 [Anaerolineae bacterium]|nr:hypothetical protein [Anaerolineae bacterium]